MEPYQSRDSSTRAIFAVRAIFASVWKIKKRGGGEGASRFFRTSVINYERTSGNVEEEDDVEAAREIKVKKGGEEEEEEDEEVRLSRVVLPRWTAIVATGKLAACLKRPLTSDKIYSPLHNKINH